MGESRIEASKERDICTVCVCVFQRERNGAWETGLYINENHIVDLDGNKPEAVEDVRARFTRGCLAIDRNEV